MLVVHPGEDPARSQENRLWELSLLAAQENRAWELPLLAAHHDVVVVADDGGVHPWR